MLDFVPEELKEWITPERIATALRVAFALLVLLPFSFIVARWVRKWATRKFSAQRGLVAGKLIRYTAVSVVVLIVFRELGFSIAPLLGAAGIVGVALAFASQTSVSNIISGLFLIAENPFSVGDAIRVGNIAGVVISIDTLSIKLRTFDNEFVRIPNETIIKSELVNITRFPVRRVDINVGVAYDSDLKRVREVLMEVAAKNPLCLMEPKPLLIFLGYGASSIDFLFGVWATRESFLELKNSIQVEIKEAFDEAEIEIPFPQSVIHYRGKPVPGDLPKGGVSPEQISDEDASR
ncbi:MAG: mechanosensitive ion channel protein [Verrucomicrobiales bacterium]|nr:mechanosensitive ion channel protein [Verrucomicrobiales bacterium]